MGLIKVFLERPRILILTLIFFLLVGYSGFNNIPRQEMPELAERWGVVIQVYPGASPDRIETQVTEILEIKLREIPEIRNLNSNLRQGSATTLVELKDEVSFDLVEKVWSEVQDKIDLTEQEIPSNARLELSRNSGPPISALYSIQWKGDDDPPLILMSRLAEQLKRKLAYLGSTEEVEIHGEANEEIVVEVDSRKLSNLGISFQNLSNLIASFDNKRSAGLISNTDEEILIKPKDNLKTISQLEDIPIAKYDSQLVKVSDIASVSQQAVTPIESYSIVDGNPAVVVQVTGSFDQRIDQYVSRANAVVEDFKKGLPEEIVVSSIYEESLYVEKRFDELTSSIGFALFLVLALSAFLLGLRSAILVALILPLTLCSVLFICQMTGLPLHQTSTTGMIIALGLLIDNAIIVVEDYRYRRLDGLGSKQAIYKSVKHLFKKLQREQGLLERDCDRMIRNDRVVWATSMVACGDADGAVTGNTRRFGASFEKIKQVVDVRKGEIMFGLNMIVHKGRTIFVGDTSVHEYPTSEQMAEMAISTARVVRLFGFDPKVAFVSHSTFGQPLTSRTKHIRNAVEILKERKVDFEFDGDMQPDVALNPEYEELYPFAKIVGKANILIMPGQHSAAISYKLMKTIGETKVIGPLLIGLGLPIEIAPLRSSTSEILNLASIAAYSSQVIDYKK